MSYIGASPRILDNDSENETDSEVVETVNGSCPCCGYKGELTYVDGDGVGAGPSRKRKRRRSRSPASQQFMRELTMAIELPRTQPPPANPPAPTNRPNPVIKTEPASYIQQFFSQYPEYAYDPAGETMSQFQQMSQAFKWKREDPEMQEAQQQLRIALTEDFNRIYGKDVNSLVNWQSLCRVLQLSDIPDDLSSCRQVVKGTFVNLVDLVDTKHTKKPVRHFESEAALRAYSRKTSKIFPKEEARAGGLLKFLLRRIFSAMPKKGRPKKRRRQGRANDAQAVIVLLTTLSAV
ncbi:hypothetical protein RhiJN_13724 [Ceratobasidium sp. AG-Ba]|nr:hypothetical protein RhiJN_13724 [Ceratobasidium sp. AG-Ba]